MSERIEGVPVGTKLAKVALAEDISIGSDRMFKASIRLVPDNVYGVIDLSTVPIPEGWERDGDTVAEWFRDKSTCINKDWIISTIGKGVILDDMNGTDRRRIHVRKIKPKTRRVLVETETRELTITDRPCGSIAEVHSSTAESLVKRQPHRYRIEERPIDS